MKTQYSKYLLITIRKRGVYSDVSMVTNATDYDLSEEGVAFLIHYLNDTTLITELFKSRTFYWVGKTGANVTVKNKHARAVADTFLNAFNKYKKEIPTIPEMLKAACTGAVL